MADTVVCNLCDAPGTFDQATDVALVPSNVRKFCHESFTVWRCRHCDSLHSKEDVDLDRYYEDYFLRDQRLDFFLRQIFRGYIRTLRRFGLRREHAILDYGCGHGMGVTAFHERGYMRTVGYDPFVAEYSAREVLESRYDGVLSAEVIEHVASPREYLAELSELVRPGGLLAIATPNATHISLQPFERDQWGLHQPFHRHILSEKVISELGQEVLLTPIFLTRRNWDHLWPAVNFRFLSAYVRASGNLIDAIVEPPRVGMVLKSPSLLFWAAFGYYFPLNTTMLVIFRKKSQ